MLHFIKKQPNVSLFILSSFINSIGYRIYSLLLPWMVFDFTSSAIWMGTIFLLEIVPYIIFSPIIGVIVDKYDEQKIIFICNLMQMLLIVLMIALSFNNSLTIISICIFTVLLTTLNSFTFVAEETIITRLVEKEDLVRANSIYQLAETLSMLLGPAVAGLLISNFEIMVSLAVNLFTFIPIVIFINCLVVKFPKVLNTHEDFKTGIFNGLNYVIKNKVILLILLTSFVSNLSNGAVDALFVFFARDQLELSASSLGIILSLSAAFQFICIHFSSLISRKFEHLKIVLFTSGISGFGIILMTLFYSWVGVGLGRAIQEGPTIMGNILNKTIRQALVPNYLLGRINALNGSISMISYSLSGFIAGVITELYDIKLVFQISGVTAITFAVIGFVTIKKVKMEDYYEEKKSTHNC